MMDKGICKLLISLSLVCIEQTKLCI